MKKNIILTAVLALCLILTACGDQGPTQEEVEAAIRDGSVTVQDALDKGWITQEWAEQYEEENTVPAADKIAYNRVGEFTTETVDGEAFTNQDMPDPVFVAFLDPDDAGFADFYQALADAAEAVRTAGADILVCSKGEMDAELFRDAPFSVIAYNDSMKQALAQNDEMASGIPCTGVWYVDGSLISAWSSEIDAEDLADSAAGFVSMNQADDEHAEDSTSAVAMG
jgi:hypothetical protein